jgi:outer membrane protein OmpA-like peptidoglycan-associated protein
VATPTISIGSSGKATSDFPQEPGWRAGMLLSYAVPTNKLYEMLFPPPGSFIASITDATNGSPIDGLIVVWNGREQEAPDGRFVHQGSTGTYVIALNANGYLPVSDTVRVEPNQLILKSYGLQRNVGTVRGTVFLGQSPGKAQLILADHPRGYEAGDNGQFKFDLPPGAYAMTVTAPGFQPVKRTFALKYKGQVVFDRLELRPAPKPVPKPIPLPVSAPTAPAPITVETPQAPPAVAAMPQPVSAPVVAKTEPPKTAAPQPEPPKAEVPKIVAAPKPKPVVPVDVETVQEKERQEWLPVGTGPLPESMESPVFFAFGSWEVDPRAYVALDRLAELLKSDESIQRLVIEGRADAVGSVQVNSKIAAERADAIYLYLASKGVERSKMATMSSFYRRKAVGQSDSVRALDRRVGFRIERE